jgi:hypothetical protein
MGKMAIVENYHDIAAYFMNKTSDERNIPNELFEGKNSRWS